MITLLVNPYSPEELKTLRDMLGVIETLMYRKCQAGTNCKQCEYRHICYDITSAKDHLIKLIEEKEKETR